MREIASYVRAKSLEEAWTLNQRRLNRVAGGMLWLRMGRSPIAQLIDLCELGLEGISEAEGGFHIGCMTSLRALETHDGLNDMTGGAFRGALKGIVGVQLRNVATVGGSVFGRFGFSDLLTLLMALDASVILHKAGEMPIGAFAARPYDRDILTRVIVPKRDLRASFQCFRNAATDFSVLNLALCRDGRGLRCAVGARPGRAMLIPGAEAIEPDTLPAYVAENTPVGSNLRGPAEYRTHLAAVLARRALSEMGGATC